MKTIHLAPLVLALITSCSSTQQSLDHAGGDWLEPSPALRQQIDAEAKRLPWTHGMERVELIHWFSRVGEPAYPTLLGMVLDPRKDVACAALAALGATRDARLVEPLNTLPWPAAGPDVELALERARTLLRLGDWSMAPHLIGGLRDERLMTRALCIQALQEATGERFGYDPRAEVANRDESIGRWHAWWNARGADNLSVASRSGQ
jgi:HEAT repeat protein